MALLFAAAGAAPAVSAVLRDLVGAGAVGGASAGVALPVAAGASTAVFAWRGSIRAGCADAAAALPGWPAVDSFLPAGSARLN